jgi:hypothetical protein
MAQSIVQGCIMPEIVRVRCDILRCKINDKAFTNTFIDWVISLVRDSPVGAGFYSSELLLPSVTEAFPARAGKPS